MGATANGKNGIGERNGIPMHGHRKSTPMMPPFVTSAPGKVIVFGEHAVVHGRAAMAASISLRSYLLVAARSKTSRTISLRFPDLGLSHTWHIDELPWEEFSRPDRKRSYYDMVTSTHPDLIEAMEPHIANVSPEVPAGERKVHRMAAASFLYLFLSLGDQSFPGCSYTLRSTLPIGAGLGSSASVNTCISCALLLQARALSGPHQDQPPEESRLQVERINRWAFVGELLIHGNPSGVDNTVASAGKAVLFKRENYAKPPTVRFLRNFPELPLLLINTRQSRSTAAEVAKVGALKVAHPEITEHILDAIDEVTTTAEAMVKSDDFEEDDADAVSALGELFNVNHGLLSALGVSHHKLERVRELVDTFDAGWTKLTGAGGGGCAITLLKPPVKTSVLESLDARLEEEDFERFEITLGGDGVGVLWPAVFRNHNGEVTGEDIDEDKFLQAKGREGVENLVGVGKNDSRQGWKFWR